MEEGGYRKSKSTKIERSKCPENLWQNWNREQDFRVRFVYFQKRWKKKQ